MCAMAEYIWELDEQALRELDNAKNKNVIPNLELLN